MAASGRIVRSGSSASIRGIETNMVGIRSETSNIVGLLDWSFCHKRKHLNVVTRNATRKFPFFARQLSVVDPFHSLPFEPLWKFS